MKIGIQGGKGSFNEEAIRKLMAENEVYKGAQIIYLYTTENVFRALKNKEIDFGVFALLNGVGGLVEESLEAISKNNFEVVSTINLPIQHFLMKRKDVQIIDSVMAHPQVFKQCKNNMKIKFSNLMQIEGGGELVDTANAAKFLAEGKISEKTAILGPKILADIYNFDVVAENMQDSKYNVTTFVLINL